MAQSSKDLAGPDLEASLIPTAKLNVGRVGDRVLGNKSEWQPAWGASGSYNRRRGHASPYSAEPDRGTFTLAA